MKNGPPPPLPAPVVRQVLQDPIVQTFASVVGIVALWLLFKQV